MVVLILRSICPPFWFTRFSCGCAGLPFCAVRFRSAVAALRFRAVALPFHLPVHASTFRFAALRRFAFRRTVQLPFYVAFVALALITQFFVATTVVTFAFYTTFCLRLRYVFCCRLVYTGALRSRSRSLRFTFTFGPFRFTLIRLLFWNFVVPFYALHVLRTFVPLRSYDY